MPDLQKQDRSVVKLKLIAGLLGVKYDDLYRLTRARYSFTLPGAASRNDGEINYRYDRIGNMLAQTSTLNHQEKGLPVANLGQMDSGGIAGRSGRVGRGANDPPGPHALTRISNPQSPISNRDYDYDPNGNMKVIDGLTCTWDFKDRLIAAENTTMRATYAYDYTDRRITKSVTQKASSPPSTINSQPSPLPETTHYLNKYYELREGDSPVKYVWNGDTRVARVTARLSSALRTQHLRLHPGWNLVCLTVGGPQPSLDPATNPTVPAALLWSATTPGNGYTALTGTTPIPAGSTAWIWSTTAQTLLLTGTAPPAASPVLTGTGQFLGNLLPERLDLAAAFPASAWLTRYQPAVTAGLTTPGTWLHRFPAGHDLAPLSDAPAWLNPGEALWITSGSPGPLNLPAAALAIRYYHQDHLGSTSVITDQSGSLVEETANYAFGHPRNSYKPGPVLPEAYGFTQKERDKESGLHYFEARYLMGNGRFASPDPLTVGSPSMRIAIAQGLNPYSYCRSSPIKLVDPSGMEEGETSQNQAPAPTESSGSSPYSDDEPTRQSNLKEAIAEGQNFTKDQSATSCNLGTQKAQKKLGEKVVSGNANTMIETMDAGTKGAAPTFKKVTPSEAHAIAKKGCLVISARKASATETSGHVSPVSPNDVSEESLKQYPGGRTPLIANMGNKTTTGDKPVNYVFGAKKGSPSFFVSSEAWKACGSPTPQSAASPAPTPAPGPTPAPSGQ